MIFSTLCKKFKIFPFILFEKRRLAQRIRRPKPADSPLEFFSLTPLRILLFILLLLIFFILIKFILLTIYINSRQIMLRLCDPSRILKYSIYANFLHFVSFKAVFWHCKFCKMEFILHHSLPHYMNFFLYLCILFLFLILLYILIFLAGCLVGRYRSLLLCQIWGFYNFNLHCNVVFYFLYIDFYFPLFRYPLIVVVVIVLYAIVYPCGVLNLCPSTILLFLVPLTFH